VSCDAPHDDSPGAAISVPVGSRPLVTRKTLPRLHPQSRSRKLKQVDDVGTRFSPVAAPENAELISDVDAAAFALLDARVAC
jgi:hypothetical protein